MKWIGRLFALVLLLVLVAGASVFLLPADRIARIAADQIRNATGRDVSITGDVAVTVWPVIGASVGGLEVGNADWSDAGPMLTADNAAIGIDAAALLRGEIRITKIEATRPTVRLEQRADGRASWQFTDAGGAARIEAEVDPAEPSRPFSIQRLDIREATLIYDAEGSDLVQYSGVDVALDWPDPQGPARIDATLRPTGAAVEVAATIDAFAGFVTGQVQPVDVSVRAGGGTASLAGRASTAGAVEGKLALDLPDTGEFLRVLGVPGVDLPRGLGQSMNISADLTLSEERNLWLRNLNADLGGNRLSGAADLSLNGTPRVNAVLEAGALDLTGLTGGAGSGAEGSPDAVDSGWDRSDIDASGLAAFNGEIGLFATSVDLGAFNLGRTRLLLSNDNSRAVFELREVQAYDGVVTGEFVVNNRSGLSVGGTLIAQEIGMQPLLADAVGIDRLTGSGDAELRFLGSGNSAHAIMNSLSGSGAVQIGRGTFQGIDLDRLMRSGDVGGGTTVFDQLGMTFAMESGNLANDDLLLRLARYEARGAGRIGLGAQDIDYTFTPIALNANDGAGIAIPVRIRGPWSDPRIIPDLEAAIDLNLAAEREALENRAEQALRDKVADELNLAPGDGQSLEDAARDKLENQVRDRLRRILD